MFVKKLVEKAYKKPGENLDGLKPNDVDLRLVFHYGIPAEANLLAYDSVQKILAISTSNGGIKLLGKDNTQALLESDEATLPSKFLQFIENEGILINVTEKNHIEVWDIDRKLMCHTHVCQEEITSFTVIRHSFYLYIGNSVGNISVLKLDQESCTVVQLKYTIPFSASYGVQTDAPSDTAVAFVLPQPTVESKRVLVVFRDGLIALWGIRENRAIFTTGGNKLLSLCHETRKVTSACWACPFGSKIAAGYNNGEILIWSVSSGLSSSGELATDEGLCASQNTPIFRLNLGYKREKIPIQSLQWAYADGKASRLYVVGAFNSASENLLQVTLLNEHVESRTIKLGLHLPEPCIDMKIISSCNEQRKHKQEFFLLLGRSGHVYYYDDDLIENYLLQCQARSLPSLPREIVLKFPFADSAISVSKFITDNSSSLNSAYEDYNLLARKVPALLPFGTKPKDGASSCGSQFNGFAKTKNLYITGHDDGTINLWDVSCPFLLPLLSLEGKREDNTSLGNTAITALYYDRNYRLLYSGDRNGTVHMYKFKPEPFASENNYLSLQGGSRKRNDHIIYSVKSIKVTGAVLAISVSSSLRHLAAGTDGGCVSLIDIEGPVLLYEKHIASELCTGVISLQFETCNLHGFEKNVLMIAMKDSSIFALDSETGNVLFPSPIRAKKPSKALYMQTLDRHNGLGKGSYTSENTDLRRQNSVGNTTQKQSSLLLCSERAVYVYSLVHVVQGVKKVHCKKKFHYSCLWASTFSSQVGTGLMLLFNNGKIEIRSLPDLSMLKETSVHSIKFLYSKVGPDFGNSICCSEDGELIMVNGDQEILFLSVLARKEIYRHLDAIHQVYQKIPVVSPEGHISRPPINKEKKKGILSSVIKDFKGSKQKNSPAMEAEDTRKSYQELSTFFAVANFPVAPEKETDKKAELNIDDVDFEDPTEKSKGPKMMAALSNKTLASRFQAFKGKLKQVSGKHERTAPKEEQCDEKAETVDEIKKKYGFSSSTEPGIAKMAKSKLRENLHKLQGINRRTAEMHDKAKSFSSMANEMLQTAEQGGKNL